MRSFCIAAAILLAGVPSLWSQDHAGAQQLLDASHNPGDLFQIAAQPFDLEIDFTIERPGQNPDANPAPVPGHLSIKWQSKDHWWSSVSTGGFEQTTIRNGEMESTLRNFPATPGILQQLFRLLRFNGYVMKYSAGRQRDRTEGGVAETCIDAQPEKTQHVQFKANEREFCYDATSHELLTTNWEAENDGRNREQFSSYQSLGPIRYPRKFLFTRHGDEVISATVTSLANVSFDASLLVPPEHAVTRRKCPDIKPPISVKRIDPVLPRGPGGDVRASLTVLADGSVSDVNILSASSVAMAQAAREAFRQYKFQPAMCGAEPVVSDSEIEVSVRRN
jgi:TonB family protein